MHDQLIQWGFKEFAGEYILSGDHCRVIVSINDLGDLEDVEVVQESNALPAPNVNTKALLFGLLYSFDLLPS